MSLKTNYAIDTNQRCIAEIAGAERQSGLSGFSITAILMGLITLAGVPVAWIVYKR